MPIDHDDIEPLLSNAQDAFRRGGQISEEGLDVSSADLVQLRKACRLLSGAEQLCEDGYYTLTIEAAFTSIERTLLFWLITEGHHDPSRPPQSHTTAISRSADVGFITEGVATELEDLWKENRAHTYYWSRKAKTSPFRAGIQPTTLPLTTSDVTVGYSTP